MRAAIYTRTAVPNRVSLPTRPALGIMLAIAEYEAEHAEDDITH